ncbi:SEC-C domain-containing protein [Chondromyces apiculatus]|uniref:SEC-C motif domain protein n=1 Tax=Chondromyces apiculatus DSM 436 TaxID=1192034 RepID=A0A017T6C4_9BACT|nr:SEC-C domain-containing protein [Chondromyces apiculatus]EYF04116.1 Hypothetical protein CAP_4799 [Chondromyces apiculatus DSM 436]
MRDEALWEAEEPRDYMAPLHAVHLLGAIGDPAATPALVAMVRSRDEDDLVMEAGASILAALGPGAMGRLMRSAGDRGLDAFQRQIFTRSLYVIAARHPAHRAEVAAFLTRLLRDPDEVFVAMMIEDVARTGDPAAQAAVDMVFEEGRASPSFITREDIEHARAEPLWKVPRDVDDPMSYFRDEALAALKQQWKQWLHNVAERKARLRRASARRVLPKRGRNQRCLCGSGKKYKKCCLVLKERREGAAVTG